MVATPMKTRARRREPILGIMIEFVIIVGVMLTNVSKMVVVVAVVFEGEVTVMVLKVVVRGKKRNTDCNGMWCYLCVSVQLSSAQAEGK